MPPYARACERGRIPRRPLALLLVTSIACAPIGMSDDEVEVTGVFLPDGRCNARSPRGAVATEPSTGELRYRFDGDFIDGRDVDVGACSNAPSNVGATLNVTLGSGPATPCVKTVRLFATITPEDRWPS